MDSGSTRSRACPGMTELKMPHHICTACGTQYPERQNPPAECRICEEERQYVPPRGQTWTTLDSLRGPHMNAFRQHEPGVTGIGSTPNFAIGQRATLVQTKQGNVLFDCIALIDEATIALLKGLGGVQAIAISHPHFYTTHVEWARAFNCPVYLHAADREWVMRPDSCQQFWDGGTEQLWDGVTLVRCGGHFPGGTVLHWAGGADGKGIVCSGDILTVAVDRKWLSFMRSYPNLIPLSRREVEGIGKAMQPFAFERIYGHYFDRVIAQDAKAILDKSVERYVAAIEGTRGY